MYPAATHTHVIMVPIVQLQDDKVSAAVGVAINLPASFVKV